MYSCWFGTFLYNNHKERKIEKVSLLTPSLWTYLNDVKNIGNYLNDSYCPGAENLSEICGSIRPRLWSEYFYRTKGIFYSADPNQDVKQFVEGYNESDKRLVKRAKRKFNKYFAKPPTIEPKVSSPSTPRLSQEEGAVINLDSFVCIEDYSP